MPAKQVSSKIKKKKALKILEEIDEKSKTLYARFEKTIYREVGYSMPSPADGRLYVDECPIWDHEKRDSTGYAWPFSMFIANHASIINISEAKGMAFPE